MIIDIGLSKGLQVRLDVVEDVEPLAALHARSRQTWRTYAKNYHALTTALRAKFPPPQLIWGDGMATTATARDARAKIDLNAIVIYG